MAEAALNLPATSNQLRSAEMVLADLIRAICGHVDTALVSFRSGTTDHYGNQREYLAIQYKNNDVLYVPIHQADRISRYIGPDSSPPAINNLVGNDWDNTRTKVRHAVVEIAADLLELYAKRQLAEGYAFSPDSDWQQELEASFPYIETPDQVLALEEIKKDMESERPMDRLLLWRCRLREDRGCPEGGF